MPDAGDLNTVQHHFPLTLIPLHPPFLKYYGNYLGVSKSIRDAAFRRILPRSFEP